MTSEDAKTFATRWVNDWNAKDVEAVLAHFADDVVFSSPVALAVTGAGTIRGKVALRAYWRMALETHSSLHFALERTLWDAAASELAIVYDRNVNGRRSRGAEVMTFGSDGLVIRGEAFYGEIPDARPGTT